MNAPAGTSDNDIREHLRVNVDANLVHLLQDNGVPLGLQFNLTQEFRTVRRFAALADSRADVRQALRDDLGVQPADLVRRAAIAAVVATWEASKDYASKESELRAEAKVLGIPRPVTQTDKSAMRAAYIQAHGALEEMFEPSDDYLSSKMEEIEPHEPTASPLSEVTSKKTAKTMGVQTTVDSGGAVRIVKQRTRGKLPSNTEELRAVLRIEGATLCFLAAKYRNKQFLQNMDTVVWQDYVNYLLGEKCYMMKVPVASGSNSQEDQIALRPPWSVLLRYELELRKEAVKRSISEGKQLRNTLKEVIKDSEIKEQYFTTPIALQGKFGQDDSSGVKWRKRPDEHLWASEPNKFGKMAKKGKGKKGKGKGKNPANEHSLIAQTPDGRQICFAFNSQGCQGNCDRIHICRVRGCGKPHAMWQHYAEAHTGKLEGGKGGDKGPN